MVCLAVGALIIATLTSGESAPYIRRLRPCMSLIISNNSILVVELTYVEDTSRAYLRRTFHTTHFTDPIVALLVSTPSIPDQCQCWSVRSRLPR